VQNVVEPLGVIVAVGNGFTVTVVGADVAEQLFPLVTVTVYVPPAITLMLCVVCPPGAHSHEVPALAVNTTPPF
jgi:hypothetical protein